VEDEKVITDWNVKERGEKELFFLLLKYMIGKLQCFPMYWEATVLPNVLGSYSASQYIGKYCSFPSVVS